MSYPSPPLSHLHALLLVMTTVITPIAAVESTGEEDWLNRPLAVNWIDQSLGDVLQELTATHGNLKLSVDIPLQSALSQHITLIDQRPNARIRDHLAHLEWLTDFTVLVRPGSVEITRDARSWQDLMDLRRYNVNDVLIPVNDFEEIFLGLPAQNKRRGFTLFCGGNSSFVPTSDLDMGMLLDMIETQIAPSSWSDPGTAADVRYGGWLYINQRPSVHRKITCFLSEMRNRRQPYELEVMVLPIDMTHDLHPGFHPLDILDALDPGKNLAHLHINGFDGQVNQSSQVQQRRFASAAKANPSGRLTVDQQSLTSGFSAQARVVSNDYGYYITYRLTGLQDLGNRRSITFHEPPRQVLSHLSESDLENKRPPMVLNIPADEVHIDLPSYYSWQSWGSALIPHGQVLVEIQQNAQGHPLAVIWYPRSIAKTFPLEQPMLTLSEPNVTPRDLIQAQAAANGMGLIIDIDARRKLELLELEPQDNWHDFSAQLAAYDIWINDHSDPWLVSGNGQKVFIKNNIHLLDLILGRDHYPNTGLHLRSASDLPAPSYLKIEDHSPINIDELMDILQLNIYPELWASEGVALDAYGTHIEITAPPFMIRSSQDFYNQLRRDLLRQIHVEVLELPAQPQLPTLLSPQEVEQLRGQYQPIASMVVESGTRRHRTHKHHHHYLDTVVLSGSTRIPQVGIAYSGLSVDVEALLSGENHIHITQRSEWASLDPIADSPGQGEIVNQTYHTYTYNHRLSNGGGTVVHGPQASYLSIFTLLPFPGSRE